MIITSLIVNRFPLRNEPLVTGDVKERILCMDNDTINSSTMIVIKKFELNINVILFLFLRYKFFRVGRLSSNLVHLR